MRSKTTIAILLAGALPGAALAVATAVTNFSVGLPGTTSAAEPVLAGTVVQDLLVPYSTPAAAALPASGRIQVRVVRGANGRLAYYWRIMADRTSRDRVLALEIRVFPRVVYDANWRRDGLGTVAPLRAYGTNGPGGWEMGFQFGRAGVRAGESSRFFFLRSDARASGPARIRVHFGGSLGQFMSARGPRL